jgi:catechol 2,3-dioxygenase-like lactoylglutathione lyase family enzyme
MGVAAASGIVDLVPFLLVRDVERSIRFYEALGFEVVKRYEPSGRLEFAGLEATSAAKVMLAEWTRSPRRVRTLLRQASSTSTRRTSKRSAHGC